MFCNFFFLFRCAIIAAKFIHLRHHVFDENSFVSYALIMYVTRFLIVPIVERNEDIVANVKLTICR